MTDLQVARRFRTRQGVLAALAALALAAPAARAAPAEAQDIALADLTELSLEQLVNIHITSVSKHEEPLFHAAAAIFVLTGEEIRRSGARTIADALRLAPGLQVMSTNAEAYTITARGLGTEKLEVVMNGRSVYSPLNSTVFWDVLDTYLPDIERIEVIRGPGATLWGANAVNGVINIITSDARDTIGTEIRAGAGNEELAYGAVRTGLRTGETGALRLFAKARQVDNAALAGGGDALDGMRYARGGFRWDGSTGERGTLTAHGGLYAASQDFDNVDIPATGHIENDAEGGNLGAQWSHRTAGGGELSLSGYYDHYSVDIPGTFVEARDTFDLALQHRLRIGENHDLTWGAGARHSSDRTADAPAFILFQPQDRSIQTFNLFVQDQVRLGDAVKLTLGSKFEHNDFTGFEVQPGVRLGWTVRDGLFTWGSVSRAVRTPNRVDHDIALYCSALYAMFTGCTEGDVLRIGNPAFDSEKLTAYEWGLRWSSGERLSVDLALFHNDYSDLRSAETSPPPFGGFGNAIEGQGSGGEVGLAWIVNDWLDLRSFYAWLDLDLDTRAGSSDFGTAANLEGASARHKAGLRAAVDLSPQVYADAFLRHVGELRSVAVPAYTELDLRLAWQPRPGLELALVGHNLLDSQHPEYGSVAGAGLPARTRIELQRSVLAEFTWRWR